MSTDNAADLAGANERIAHAPCGLLSTRINGAISSVNTTFCTWLGYRQDELAGVKLFADLLPMGVKVFYQTHWVPLLQAQGSVSEMQLELLHRDGSRVPMMLNVVRHAGTAECDGHDEIAVFVTQDRARYERELRAARARAESALGELEQAEANLRDVNTELSLQHTRKDEFLATLAHELRNPLAPIVNVLETMALKNYDDPHLLWAQQVLRRQTQQLTHLVDDLLEISRITQNRLALRREWVDLGALARATADNCRPAYQAALQQLSVETPVDPVWAWADPTRMTQILTNLLTNASKYTPDGGAATLSVGTDHGDVVLLVRDSGIGIPADKLQSVFGMFSQVHPALERSQGGLGIGLALVHGLVALHGGTVLARSGGAGAGSEFEIRLPAAADAPAPAPDAVQSPVTAAAGIRVVVIDDNVDAAESLAMALDMLGYEVSTGHDGAAALALAARMAPEFMVLDIGLPDISGYDVARQVRATAGGDAVVLIAATGWGQAADKQAAVEAGFDAHFTKPVDFYQLDETIKALRRPR